MGDNNVDVNAPLLPTTRKPEKITKNAENPDSPNSMNASDVHSYSNIPGGSTICAITNWTHITYGNTARIKDNVEQPNIFFTLDHWTLYKAAAGIHSAAHYDVEKKQTVLK